MIKPMRDPYIDPVTGILKNKLNIREQSELAETEAELTTTRFKDLYNEIHGAVNKRLKKQDYGGLTMTRAEAERESREIAASFAVEGMFLTKDEIEAGIEILMGKLTADEYIAEVIDNLKSRGVVKDVV